MRSRRGFWLNSVDSFIIPYDMSEPTIAVKDEQLNESIADRLRAEPLLVQRDKTEAEASFQKAVEVARRQQAKSWELRATVSLCRLWRRQGRRAAAHQRLTGIYDWFTEGFDTPDLKEARAMLDELA